ncbi:MAG: AMP-binding protein [Hespellia sp.]|nr:AMP-binding protein [Hespellia sp.]
MKENGTLIDILRNASVNFSDRGISFCGAEKKRITYNELNARAIVMARTLKEWEISKGDHVFICIDDLVKFTDLFWGSVYAGAVIELVPFGSDKLADSIQGKNLITESETKILISDRMSFSDSEWVADIRIINADALIYEAEKFLNSEKCTNEKEIVNERNQKAVAFALYTSGTEGKSKRIEFDNAQVVSAVQRINSLVGRFGGDITANILPLFHVIGFFMFYVAPVQLGIEQIQIPYREFISDPKLLFEVLKKNSVTDIDGMNYVLRTFVEMSVTDEEKKSLERVKNILLCGEVMDVSLIDKVQRKYNTNAIRTFYGMTECLSCVTKPKGVMISQQGAVNTVQDLVSRYEMTSMDKFMIVSSFSFDLSVFDIFGSVYAGGSLYVSEGAKNIYGLRKICKNEGITIWNSVPTIWKLVLDGIRKGEQLPNMRIVLISGDKIPQELFTSNKNICPNSRFISLGGATEASIWSILYEVEELKNEFRGRIPYGYPMKNQTIYVLDEKLKNCYPEVEGEICIGGIGIALGYKGDGEQTKKHFIEHPKYGRIYRTGDLGMYRREGYVDILGRIDNQVKVNGFRIELDEIEGCIRKIEGIKDVAVVLLNNHNRKQIAAFVVTDETDFNQEKANEAVNSSLPEYMVPKTYQVLKEIPLTANRKVDRKKLMNFKLTDTVSRTLIPPKTEYERKLFNICKENLDQNIPIDVTKSFFEMEVDSVQLLTLMEKVNAEFGTNLSVQEFLSHTSIRKLALLFEDREGDEDDD